MKQLEKWLTLWITKKLDLLGHYSIIRYAVQVVVEEFITFLIAMIITLLCFGEIGYAIVFACAFSVLRQFAGGIHANTYCKCMIATICMFGVSIWSVYNVYGNILLAAAIISSVGIWYLSPVVVTNKKTSLIQQKKSQQIVHQLLVFYWILVCIVLDTRMAKVIQMALVMVFILQAMGEIVSQCRMKRKYFPKQMQIANDLKISVAVLAFCVFVCQNTVQSVSAQWCYQTHIPDDIQRKFYNM